MRLSLEPEHWYATEFIGEEFEDEIRSYSPIKIRSLKSTGGGSRRFELSFYHANYPEGVREKTYALRTIERNRSFILASSINHNPTRLLLIYRLSAEWLVQHFDADFSRSESPVSWLERNA